MADNAQKFDEDYVIQLLKLAISDRKYLDVFMNTLEFEYIINEDLKKVWKAIKTEYRLSDNKKIPSISTIAESFKKDRGVRDKIVLIKDSEDEDPEHVFRHFESFIKRNMFLEIFNSVAKLHNKDEMDKAYELFFSGSEKLHSFSLKEKTFDKIFDGFNSRMIQREFDKLNDLNKRVRIRFHIDELDFLIKGAETGEAVLFLGDSGVGKSFLLAWCGMAAARQGYKVAHFQAEGTREQCLDRYDSAFTGIKYWDIKENNISNERMIPIKKVLSNKGRGDIIVEAFEKFESHTMVDIRNSIKEIKKIHTDLKYVVLDYLELVDPGDGKKYAPSEERFRQSKIGRAIKDIAVEENVVFITATQANSIRPEDLENPNFVITRFNLSEDKGKTRPFDLFITINQTKEEKKENIVRLYIDKAREHSSKQVITMYQNLAHSRFYDKKRTLQEFFTDDKKEEIELMINGKKFTKLDD